MQLQPSFWACLIEQKQWLLMTVDSKQSFSIHIFFNEILYVQTCKYSALKVIGPQKNTCTVFSLLRKVSETETWVALAHVWLRGGGDSSRVINEPTCPMSVLTCEHQPLQEQRHLAQFASLFPNPLQAAVSLKKFQVAYTVLLSKNIMEEVLCYAAVK